jgi:hypothetical protein
MRGSEPRNSFCELQDEDLEEELRELKFPEINLQDLKIPQAVAYVLLISALATAQTAPEPNQEGQSKENKQSQSEVVNLLRDFLSHVSDPAMHERFWADEVVYTGSNGKFRTKTEIVKNVREGGLAKPGDPQPTFAAEDITTHVFGDTVVVAFRLVNHAGAVTDNYRNPGTFLRRNGRWQVVAWQATKIPDQQEQIKK